MNIIRASQLGMCFGVRDAIHLALNQSQPISILGDLVHNETVLSHLQSQGVQIKHQVADVSTPAVMITAHGASNKTRDRIRQRGLELVEATCPLVHYAHLAIQRLARDGYHPVLVGKRDHVEVRGLTEDLPEFDVILDPEDVPRLPARTRFGLAAQTTQPIDRVHRLVALVRATFPQSEVRFIDTVCQPTKQRQSAAIELAARCDVVIVIGGAHSNNTHELAATCRLYCDRVHQVRDAGDLHGDWFDQANTVGITAGTSTPDALIDGVETWIREFEAFQRQLAQTSISNLA